jgi:tetratricopeptide (TPR) repeat protein
MPKAGITDLPMPKAGITDLPMPKAGITDLPMPKPGGGGADLPAPKGFFDDLPQPARSQGSIDLPAPKGFFDDLPQPAKSSATAPQSQDIAPKGFFDDLPQPAKPGAGAQDIAPKGFFDDLPQPSGKPATVPPPAPGLFDDIQQPTAKSAANAALGAGDIDLGPSDSSALELDSNAGPELDLGLPLGQDQAFHDLDLSPSSTQPKPVEDGSPIKIKTPGKGGPAKPIPINVPKPGGAGSELSLDLAEDPHDPARTGRPAAQTAQKITPKKKEAPAEESPEARAAKRRRSRMILMSLLGVVALGAGGLYFYQRHAAAKEKAEQIDRQLKAAESAMRAADAKHWDRAKGAADQALALDSSNPRALGLAAEAALAGALDTGVNREARVRLGRKLIQDALGAGRTSPEIERAQVVSAIAGGQAQRGVDLARAQLAKTPKDGWMQLYLGWANLEKADAGEAAKAFEQAMTLSPATKLSALYGHGQAKLLLADVAAAKTDFSTILETAKDHVCAQIGLIETYPPAQSVQQVAELEAVLLRKDIGAQDPRCIVKAHTLIGDVHRAAGRLDMARQRYRDALKLVPLDVQTHGGLAAVELREGKLQVAADHIQKALAANGEHAETLILQADLSVREGKLSDAEAIVEKLAARQPPLPPLTQARLFTVKGKLLDAKGQTDDALAAFTEGAKLAGNLDLTPTMAAVTKLSELAKKAPDPAQAAAFRERADKLLQAHDEAAREDAQLSITLGIAYLSSGDPAKAETALRRASALESDDPEAKLQLAKALDAQGKSAEAIAQLEEALKLDGKRTDIALELAVTHQSAGNHDAAIAAYDKLLALPDVPTVVRVNAGRYYAKHKMIEKAAEQAEPILSAEPDNPGGLYLKAEGLIKADKPEEASPILTKATDIDPDPQYLDALGRALEARWKKSDDGKYIEGARFAYERATKADAKMFHPWLGQGRMLVARKDWDAAIVPLVEANQLDPTHAEVMYFMGRAYYGLRMSSQDAKKTSPKWLEKALKARPELDLATRAEASFMLGNLYNDLNQAGDAGNAARSWENAIRLGEEIEKQTTKGPTWLIETYYELGDLYGKLNTCPAQKRAWQRYYDRTTNKSSVRYNTVRQALATSLTRC